MDEDAQARRRELIGRAMTWLTPKEQEVVRRRLLVHEPETLEELGASFDLTRERIRQIEAKAMRKLEKALRMIMAKDDAVVLWDGPLPAPAPVAPRPLPPLPPPAPPPPAPPPKAPAVEPAPISVVATAAPAPEPLRAKPIPPRPAPVAPPPPPPSPPQPRRPLTRGEAEAARVAAIRPLKPPTRKPAEDAVVPAPRGAEANRAMRELA